METNGVTRGLHLVLDQTSKEEQSLKVKLTAKGQATGLKDWVHGASDWFLESGFSGAPRPHASSHKCCKPTSSPFLQPSKCLQIN